MLIQQVLIGLLYLITFKLVKCGVIFQKEGFSSLLTPGVKDFPFPVKLVKVTNTVAIPVPYPVHITREVQVPVTVTKPVPYPVPHPVPVHVSKPIVIQQAVPVEVPKPIPIPHPVLPITGGKIAYLNDPHSHSNYPPNYQYQYYNVRPTHQYNVKEPQSNEDTTENNYNYNYRPNYNQYNNPPYSAMPTHQCTERNCGFIPSHLLLPPPSTTHYSAEYGSLEYNSAPSTENDNNTGEVDNEETYDENNNSEFGNSQAASDNVNNKSNLSTVKNNNKSNKNVKSSTKDSTSDNTDDDAEESR